MFQISLDDRNVLDKLFQNLTNRVEQVLTLLSTSATNIALESE